MTVFKPSCSQTDTSETENKAVLSLVIHITRGGPAGATNAIVYSLYREFYFNGNYGYASAQAMILMLIMLIFTILQFGVLERRVHYQ